MGKYECGLTEKELQEKIKKQQEKGDQCGTWLDCVGCSYHQCTHYQLPVAEHKPLDPTRNGSL